MVNILLRVARIYKDYNPGVTLLQMLCGSGLVNMGRMRAILVDASNLLECHGTLFHCRLTHNLSFFQKHCKTCLGWSLGKGVEF